jgi:hypothetical protein
MDRPRVKGRLFMQKQFNSLTFRPVQLVAAALAVVLTLALTSAALANPTYPPTSQPLA